MQDNVQLTNQMPLEYSELLTHDTVFLYVMPLHIYNVYMRIYCVHVYVCMYICIYVYVYMYMNICTCIYVYAYMRIYVYVYVYICICVYVYIMCTRI